jgi:hypothetical protein
MQISKRINRKQWQIGALGCLMLFHAASAQARTIDAFAGDNGGSGSATSPGFSQFGSIGPNSFPPENDPAGIIGPLSGATPETSVRIEWLTGPVGASAGAAINTSTLNSIGKVTILANAGVETRTTLTWDGPFTPGPGLGGQDITDSPSGPNCAPTATADRFVFAALDGDANVQVELIIKDIAGNIATFTQNGLPAGSVEFPYTAFVNVANVDFTSVNAITIVFSGVATTLSLEEITTGCDPLDADGDGITDTQDACSASDLSTTVMVGACDSEVKNPLFPSGCTLSDLVTACTTGRNPRGCTNGRTKKMRKLEILTDQQREAILDCF